MTVRQMIEELSKLDQDKKVRIEFYIERGRGGSGSCSYDFSIQQSEDIVEGEDVVINVSGEELYN